MIVDAYAHIGFPRFGTPSELCTVWDQWDIEKGCIALPPGMPDFDGLAEARRLRGERVRLFGIPYGPDPASVAELAELQVRFGVSGMRLAPEEILGNRDLLPILGEAGLCLMAINTHASGELTRLLISWLETYPQGRIAAPHFLSPTPLDRAADDPGAFRDLLRHPRMFGIFSRHGGISNQAHPHLDLRPWVEEVVALMTWKRVMWGSEIPVIYHRDEQVEGVLDWLAALGISMGSEDSAAYRGGNAERLFFSRPAPPAEPVALPQWVSDGLAAFIEANDPVPVVRTKAFNLPMDLHGALLSEYLTVQRSSPDMRFQEFLALKIGRTMESRQ